MSPYLLFMHFIEEMQHKMILDIQIVEDLTVKIMMI